MEYNEGGLDSSSLFYGTCATVVLNTNMRVRVVAISHGGSGLLSGYVRIVWG